MKKNVTKKLRQAFKTWCAKKNETFTRALGCGEDEFTNGEVLKAHIGLAVGIPAMYLLTALTESL